MTHKKQRLLLGAHMSIEGGIDKSIQRGESLGCTAIQIFTKSNRQWHARPLTNEQAVQFQEALQASSITSVIAHASYLINLGSPQKETEEKSRAALVEELKRCQLLGVSYLVLHPGAHLTGNRNECLRRIAYNLDKALDAVPGEISVLLENTAGQGSNVGNSLEELAYIRSTAENKGRIQFCFDTCHAFAAGYDLRTPESYNLFWNEYDRIIGIENIRALHINDSQKELGSRVDRHDHIGQGKIGLEAFGLIINDQRFFAIPKILETPKETDMEDDKKNMDIVRSLVSQETRTVLEVE